MSCLAGAAPVMPPLALVGKPNWDMKTFHSWSLWLLGSTCLSEPYQTASACPGPPALIHGKTLEASPLAVEPSLSWTGAVHCVHPLAALDALTNTWRSAGLSLSSAQTANRLRAVSIESTEKRTSGSPFVSAMRTSLVR